jgi:hypothetical protein
MNNLSQDYNDSEDIKKLKIVFDNASRAINAQLGILSNAIMVVIADRDNMINYLQYGNLPSRFDPTPRRDHRPVVDATLRKLDNILLNQTMQTSGVGSIGFTLPFARQYAHGSAGIGIPTGMSTGTPINDFTGGFGDSYPAQVIDYDHPERYLTAEQSVILGLDSNATHEVGPPPILTDKLKYLFEAANINDPVMQNRLIGVFPEHFRKRAD